MDRLPFLRSGRNSNAAVGCTFFLCCAALLMTCVSGAMRGVYRYNICNGLSNQLLYHAASIADAAKKKQRVEIPDYFIVNGVQTTDKNVLPNASNSIPFGVAFDKQYFLSELSQLGIDATFATFDFSSEEQIQCRGMGVVQSADPFLMQQILEAFRPSEHMQQLIQSVTNELKEKGLEEGICVHHRNGQDWHDHCARWGSIPDGVYRGNCLEVKGRTFVESLQDRGLTNSKWVYYCGDHDVPEQLSSFTVLTKDRIMPEKDRKAIQDLHPGETRDLWALIDFFVCRSLDHFIGNSVSTFSAIQIAIRDGVGAYWYNSQSIPLADIWKVYQMPIVYTFTELSASTGKHLLQSSIISVRQQMPNNVIHILYHGKEDVAFRQWLKDQRVIVHDHDPSWRPKIEEMRLNGDPASSHLFLHAGNYFGTWQRIDIPLFIESEYCLLLDADTVLRRPFTIADFGLDLTYGIAMSSEMHPEDKFPSNAGVTLMNVPHLRQTYHHFLDFILSHVKTAKFDHPSPSDQGAYLVFYKNVTRFLAREFNFKPYWQLEDRDFRKAFIVHFHGPKPHDYLRFIIGKGCSKAVIDLCRSSMQFPFLCRSLHYFAKASRSVDENAYCKASFQVRNHVLFCGKLFESLAEDGADCSSFSELAWDVVESIPTRTRLPREVMQQKLKIPASRTTRGIIRIYVSWTLVWFVVAVLLLRFWKRKQAIAILVFLWVIGTSLISHVMLSGHRGSKGPMGTWLK